MTSLTTIDVSGSHNCRAKHPGLWDVTLYRRLNSYLLLDRLQCFHVPDQDLKEEDLRLLEDESHNDRSKRRETI